MWRGAVGFGVNRWAVLALCAAFPAQAQPFGSTSPVEQTLVMDVAIFADSFHVIDASFRIGISEDAYEIDGVGESRGLFGVIFPWKNRMLTEGVVLSDGRVKPSAHRTDGRYIISNRKTHIEYDGDAVMINTLLPSPEEDEREPVPQSLWSGSLDPLSVALQAALAVPGDLSSCPAGERHIFDGRRLSRVWLENTDNAPPEPDGRGLALPWPTLKCAVKTETIAGRWTGERRSSGGVFSRREETAPVDTHIFFARPDPALAAVPVRVERRGGWQIVALLTGLRHAQAQAIAVGGRQGS